MNVIGDAIGEALAQVERLRAGALSAIESAGDTADLESVRIRFTGKKSELNSVMQMMGKLRDKEQRVTLGAAVNAAKGEIERALEERSAHLSRVELAARLEAGRLDVTLPGTPYERGYRNPVLNTMDELVTIFEQMGYAVYEGPEVEWDEFNFQLLNFPPDHPARDLQDTFYVTGDMLMRTQTSPAQIRVMRTQAPPIRVIVPGMVYRDEAEDATHLSEFFQIEGLAVDREITLADLKGTLTEVVQRYFGRDRGVRFRPHYFPFTEPSAEIDISCFACGGAGCRSCGGKGWLELGGAGMVHPIVLQNGGIDPEEYTGFAFGLGPDRFTMMRGNITDVRYLRHGDLRFLRQFS
jgi:phenylalanyl-tRNA synthetase alpha chain